MVIVEEIGYIIDQMREFGSFEGATIPTDLKCNYVLNCDSCNKVPTSGLNHWYSLEPYYYFGTREEILRRLSEKDSQLQRKNQIKYPAIFLEMPFREKAFTKFPEVELNLYFANNTQSGWTYAERYENNIKPIIYPLINKFEKAVETTDNVMAYDFIEKTDAPFYALKDVIANEILDLVQLKTKIIFNNSCKNFKLCKQ
jgi:hypothetical protein